MNATRYYALGNGSFLVDIDGKAQVRDVYFPYVGQENQVNGKRHRIGIWVNGDFSWFDEDAWKKILRSKPESMASDIEGEHAVGLKITLHDSVHHEHTIFFRNLTVTNLTNEPKDVRLFFYQRFELYEYNIGDTVYYHPSIDAIIHYKGKRYFLMNGLIPGQKPQSFSNFTTGLAGEHGLKGTYVDAQDGCLSGNTIEHGSVDSTIEFRMPLKGKETKDMYYWICAGHNYYEVSELNYAVHKFGPDTLMQETSNYWAEWVNRTPFQFMGLSERVVDLFKRSLFFIHAHVDKRGSIIASSDSEMLFRRRDSYAYMWPRDGALIAHSLDRAGYSDITKNFFEFCVKAITPEGYLFHKYRPDGSLGSSWHSWVHEGHVQLPIQEDQIGLVLDALWKHYKQTNDREFIQQILDIFIRKSADFLVSFRDKKTGLPYESYDLWEEKLGIHTFTCCAVYAGLKAAAQFEGLMGITKRSKMYDTVAEEIKEVILQYMYDPQEKRFIKGLYYDGSTLKKEMTNDASNGYGVFAFGVLDVTDERVTQTIHAMKEQLAVKTSVGGYARYVNDMYHHVSHDVPGNPWFITTLWLAEYYIARAQKLEDFKPALEIFEWVADHALSTGALPEQMNPFTGQPLSVTPLTWSHAGFVIAVNKYLERLDTLGICQMCNPPKF